MTGSIRGRDAFRPFGVEVCCGRVWVLDARHPVAVVFNSEGLEPDKLISWPQLIPGRPRGRPPRIATTNAAFWIQYWDSDEVALITLNGVQSVTYTGGAELVAAGSDGAWFKRSSVLPRDLSGSRDVPPRYEPASSLLHIDLTGNPSQVPVEGWAYFSREEHGTLFVSTLHEPWERVLVDRSGDGADRPDRYQVEWTRSELAIALDKPAPNTVGRQDHAATWLPADTSYLQDYADESYNPDHLRKRADSETLRWHWGRRTQTEQTMVVRAFDVASGELVWENATVDGWVMRAAALGSCLWVVLRLFTRAGGGTRLEVWNSQQQTVQIVDAVVDLDVSEHRWPLVHRPADHASYVDYWVSRLDGASFSEHVSDVSAMWVGDWPDGHIELTYRHDGYQGLLLRSRISLYDAVGRRFDLATYPPGDWMFEQAGTRDYPARSRAVNGILDVSTAL